MSTKSDPTSDVIRTWLAAYGAQNADAAFLLCDRHDADQVAFTAIEPDLTWRDLTYGELQEDSRRLATVLQQHGVRPGDRVPVLMGKRPELVVALLAILRLGAVYVPLFTAFATDAIRMRLEGAQARLVITEPSQSEKVTGIGGVKVLQVGPELDRLIKASAPRDRPVAVGGDGAMLQLYTSGTTGRPKAVRVPMRALAAFQCYVHYSLDVSQEDTFWNAADPGWAYGLYYGVLGPLIAGRRNLLFNSGFTPESTASVMKEFGVTNFAGAPTMYRALSNSGIDLGIDLRRASSAGEPLTPDVVAWSKDAIGTEVRDHYGQTEMGMAICNSWNSDIAQPTKPGSMGVPMPGFAVVISDGQLAIEVARSPLMWFTGYHENPTASAERFSSDGSLYMTGDTGHIDVDGYFHFAARNDDLILAAGYRIGPFDVESVLVAHRSVAEVAVVGRPDPEGIRGDVVEAFIVLADGFEASDDLVDELKQLVRDRYSKHAYPRAVHFVASLPKTPSGKIQRFLLRQEPSADDGRSDA